MPEIMNVQALGADRPDGMRPPRQLVEVASPDRPALDPGQGGACGGAGPASVPGSALARPAWRMPGHTRLRRRSASSFIARIGAGRGRLPGPHCPAPEPSKAGSAGGCKGRSRPEWRLPGRAGIVGMDKAWR